MARKGAAEIVDPRPASLVQSLRAVGYTLPAAIADVLDNSIAAGAKRIDIEAFWDGPDSFLSIRDDGHGMDAPMLVEAMRLGSHSPLEERARGDLGRFGLGLKTASFSQCRRLTVASKVCRGTLATRRWDIDVVTRTDEWRLLQDPAEGSENRLPPLGASGTVVLWELLDRVVSLAPVSDNRARDRFLQQLALAKRHLGLVFHRFLTGKGRIALSFNGQPVEPWDPFLRHHEATQQLPRERVGRDEDAVDVQPFVLPHVSRLAEAEHRAAAGPAGWTAQQGFYIFRNDRLLVAGDWLGLGMQRDEHYKLARIAIELPSKLDLDWAIDVKKSRARPPEQQRDDFRRIAEATRKRAADVYRHRGKVLARTAGAPELLWVRKVTGGKCSYTINRDHPLVKELLTVLNGHARSAAALIRLLEETVPVPTILIDGAERPEALSTPFERAPRSELVDTALAVYEALRKSGLDAEMARRRVLAMEPFPQYADIVHAALEREIRTD